MYNGTERRDGDVRWRWIDRIGRGLVKKRYGAASSRIGKEQARTGVHRNGREKHWRRMGMQRIGFELMCEGNGSIGYA